MPVEKCNNTECPESKTVPPEDHDIPPFSNYGHWCKFDSNKFCQERTGCENCTQNPLTTIE